MHGQEEQGRGFLDEARDFLRLPLIRLLAANLVAGCAAAVAAVAALIGFDVAGMGRLIGASEDPVLAIVLLLFGFVVTLAGVAMATAVMWLPYDHKQDEDRGKRVKVDFEPVPVRAGSRRRQGAR